MTQPDIQELMAQAARVQAELQRAQQELAEAHVQGTAGNGLVTATITGAAELVDITIDKSVVDPEDVETLQDLIVGALRDAHQRAADLASEKMGPLSEGLGQFGM